MFIYVFLLRFFDVLSYGAEDWLILADLVLDCDLMLRFVDSFN